MVLLSDSIFHALESDTRGNTLGKAIALPHFTWCRCFLLSSVCFTTLHRRFLAAAEADWIIRWSVALLWHTTLHLFSHLSYFYHASHYCTDEWVFGSLHSMKESPNYINYVYHICTTCSPFSFPKFIQVYGCFSSKLIKRNQILLKKSKSPPLSLNIIIST